MKWLSLFHIAIHAYSICCPEGLGRGRVDPFEMESVRSKVVIAY